MSTVTERSSTVWVCIDCYFAHHGITEDERGEPYPEGVLSQLDEYDDVTAGLLWTEHDSECANRLAGQWVDECSCEQIEFTWAACHGCGSRPGGSREALTVWWKEES